MPAVAGRPVRPLGDPDVRRAVQETLDRHPRLDPGEWGAGTAVDAAAEGDVLSGVRTLDVEDLGVGELTRIAVRGAVDEHDRGLGGQFDPAHGRGCPRQPEVTLDWVLGAPPR